MLANIVLETFKEGGPIMYPMLAVMIVAGAVVLERIVWWFGLSAKRQPDKLDRVYGALEVGDVSAASLEAENSTDPVVRVVWNGLNNHHASLQGALSVASGMELQRAGRFLVAMDTLITIAPLLGLIGTVTGIMSAFRAVGESGLEVSKVSGGIGEALIATAAGLAVAIVVVLFYNYFGTCLTKLQYEIESAANNLEIMLEKIKNSAK